MGFLNNAGDIILDAVLTDTGRMRLSKGDGSFRISKFALADDEIDYGLYDKNNASGSAYYDITILQTPVFEAFTNNTSFVKSKLLTVNRNDILFLPIIKLFTTAGQGSAKHSSGTFVIPVDKTTVDNLGTLGAGILNGYKPNDTIAHIATDQGLDTTQISSEETLAMDLVESQYIIEMDNRLGSIFPPPNAAAANLPSRSPDGPMAATPSFIDDDGIASYFFTRRSSPTVYLSNLVVTAQSSLSGPRVTRLQFRLGASLELRTSTFLFEELGTLASVNLNNAAGNQLLAPNYRFIDSTVRISGVNTGYRIDVPIRFVKSI